MSMPFVKGSIGKEICTGYRPENLHVHGGGMVGILRIFGLTVLKRHCVSLLRSVWISPNKN